MPVISPTITTNTTPAISLTLSGNTTYQQFKNSLGQYVYFVNRAYLYSPLLKQIQGGFAYSKYDSDGSQNLQTVVSAISPYQYSTSIYLNLEKKNLIIDGRDYVRFNMYPNNSLQIKLYVYRISNADAYDAIGLNSFLMWQEQSNEPDFFDDYKDLL